MPPLQYFPWVVANIIGFGPILSTLARFDGFSHDSHSLGFVMSLWMAFIHYGSGLYIRIQVRMKIPRTVARAEEQKIKYSLTELMILQQSINDRAA